MASNFPGSIDSFINPVYTKVNGVDYVKAAHINDLQDAVRNTQIVITGAGLSMGLSSNNYVPSGSSVKVSIELLDGAIKLRENEFDDHVGAVEPTDPFQHHSNVIQVTAIGNLNSTRAQQAFEEHQADIDAIMTGGFVEGFTLDDRYLLVSGGAVTGSLTVGNDLTVSQNTTLGSSLSHTVTMSGDLSVGRDLLVSSDLEVGGDITLPNTSKIGAKDFFEYTNIAFLTTGMHLKSFKDFLFTLDSNDPIDAESTNSKFEIQNGLGTAVFSVDETGLLTVLSTVSSSDAEVENNLTLGSTTLSTLSHNKLEVENDTFTIKLDSDADSSTSALVVTRDGDAGTSDNSLNLILKADHLQLIGGSKVQRKGVPETGYFGIKFYSDNAGGKFQGYGVNFKSKMLDVPASVTLTIDVVNSSNYSNVTITDLNEYGFFVECDSVAVGHVVLKGTYTTVGN